jgi:hypothetical protein
MTHILIDAWQTSGWAKRRMRPERPPGMGIVHAKYSSSSMRHPVRLHTSSIRLFAETPRSISNDLRLVFVKHLAQLAKRPFRILLPASEPALAPVSAQQIGEGFHTFAAFYEPTDIDLTAEEVSHLALIVVQRRDHEQIHEWRSIPTIVEYGLTDLLAGSKSFDHAAYSSIGRLWALQEATVPANGVFSAVLSGVVELCRA